MLDGVDSLAMAEEGASLGRPQADPLEATVLRIRSGEVDAFEDLMLATEKQVLGVAWRILGDQDLARDAAQETFLRIYRSLDTYRLGESFQAWMYRIAANVCCDLARKRGPAPVSTDTLEASGSEPAVPPSAEEAVLLRQRRDLVHQALDTLPPAERAALVLRDLEGLSTEEVARALGVRPVTIRSQVASARTKVQAFCSRLLRRPAGGRS